MSGTRNSRREWLLLMAGLATLAQGAGAKAALIDINSATLEELETLPGIRDARALAIVKNRPYANKEQLVTRKVISAAAYKRIRGLIVARQRSAGRPAA